MRAKMAWGLALLTLLALLVFWASRADEILHLAKLWAVSWKGAVAAHPLEGWLGMLALGAVVINSPVPLAALVKVLSGFFFGVAGGAALNLCISVIGGLLGFMASRHLFHRALYRRFSHQLARVNLDIARNGFWYVLSARLLMATPFFLVNVLAGLSCIRKRKFLLGTMLGVLPSSTIYAMSGSQLGSISSVSELASPQVAWTLAILAATAVIPALLGRKNSKSR